MKNAKINFPPITSLEIELISPVNFVMISAKAVGTQNNAYKQEGNYKYSIEDQ
jgi:hypothetical protein